MANNGTSNGHAKTSLKCIVCGNTTVEQFLDLGKTALANKFLAREELHKQEPTYPLCVGFCRTCGHIQLTEIVPPPAMFEDYLYISSASDTLKAHLYELSDICVERYRLRATDLVIDIGCNDGTLLSGFQRHGVRTLGVDPAANLAELTRDKGIDRYVGFFNSTSAKQIREQWGPASLITATNTFPHIPELQDFVEGIKIALAPGGVFVIEAHYLIDILEQGAFDTIYHEHVSYWALGPMSQLFAQHGMEIVRAERLPIHHGQVRVAVQRTGEGQVHPSVGELLKVEQSLGIGEFATYERFAQQTLQLKRDLQHTLRDLRQKGCQVAAYGAPAKGNTLLSFLELTPDVVGYIADRSPLKQGRYTPGTHIPVVSPQQLLTDQPDYVVLLAWNFVDEVLAQQAEYRSRGGKFIIPVPQVQIVSVARASVQSVRSMGIFTNNVAVVTGASSGVGLAIARQLATLGARVCLVGRNRENLKKTAAEVQSVSAQASIYKVDLTQSESIAQFVSRLRQDVPRVDLLIHSAGVIARGTVETTPVEDFDWHYSTNVRAPYFLTQQPLPLLRRHHGQIVFINSSAALNARAEVSQYAATKSALKALADSLREEVNADGIRVLSIFLGRTATPMQASLYSSDEKPYSPELLLQPEDVAAVICHALSLPRTAEVTEISMRPLLKSY